MPKKYTRGALELGGADDDGEPSANRRAAAASSSRRALVVVGGGTLAFAAGAAAPWENSSCDATRSACFADAIAFSAQNTYHRCITPPSQYLLLDAFSGDMCRPKFLPTLAAFVGRAVPAGAYAVRGCPQDTALK